MVVTLSPSGYNGWETWFSLEYGKDMATLAIPVQAVKPISLDTAAASVRKAAEKAREELARTPESGAPASKYYAVRLAAALELTESSGQLGALRGDAEQHLEAGQHLQLLRDRDRSKFLLALAGVFGKDK